MYKTLGALVLGSMFMLGCGKGGGGDLAAQAEKHAEAACACKDFDCTKEHIKALNIMGIKQEAEVKKLSEDRLKVYKAAQTKASDCQNKLRTP